MNYQETIDFLYSRLPVFHNIGARAFKPGLHTTRQLCEFIGNPQDHFKSIHVGGTNGKGSSSHMLAAILQSAGYRVGLYTSPHLKSFKERIRVNGAYIEEEYVSRFIADNLSNIDKLSPSFFEVTVAMAFSYFRDCHVDVAVIEVGMGGRLDSTNIITPVLSLITNVSLDHTQFLGDTVDKIAFEKAGIIKPGVPVVVSEEQEGAISDVFEEVSQQQLSPLTYGSRKFEVGRADVTDGALMLEVADKETREIVYTDLRLDLTGSYQLKNICGVLASVELLNKSGFGIGRAAVYKALATVTGMTGLKGRWQKLGESPLIYCDTAHNFAGISDTMRQFGTLPASHRRFVIGFVADKDISAILALFPDTGTYYFCQPSNLRALAASDLAFEGSKYGLAGNVFANVNEALQAAKLDSGPGDCIYVGGSTFVVADINDL